MGAGDWKNKLAEIDKKTLAVTSSKYFIILLLVLLVVLAGYFRVYSYDLPITEDWAEQTIQNQFTQQQIQQLRQEYPTLPQDQLQQRAQQEYHRFYEENQEQIRPQIQQLSQQFKQQLQLEYTKPDGTTAHQTYPIGIDSYYFLQRAENILETGDVCTSKIDGECRDDNMLAPHGRATQNYGYDYVMAGFAKVGEWLGGHKITGAFMFTSFMFAIGAIAAFFIGKRRYGTIAGLVAGAIIAIHPATLGRTPGGFLDTDSYTVLFPLLSILVLFWALDQKDLKNKYLGILGVGAIAGLHAWFWNAWYFNFVMLFCVLAALAGFKLMRWLWDKDKKDLQESLHSLGLLATYTASAFVLVGITTSFARFSNGISQLFYRSTGLQDPINPTLWPNVFTTVAELNVANLETIIGRMGGELLLILAALGALVYTFNPEKMKKQDWYVLAGLAAYYTVLVFNADLQPLLWLFLFALPLAALLLYDAYTGRHEQVHYGLLLMGWLVASLYTTTQGTRFTLLIIPAYAIAIAFFFGWSAQAAKPLLKKHLPEAPKLTAPAAAIILATLFIFTAPAIGASYLSEADNIATNQVPAMNDAWWDSLTTINQNSSEDAIITSWWDFGHWFKYVADRRVTFDGASQNRPAAHWVGLALSTDNYQESLAIVRMLNCGQNDAYETIREEEPNTVRAYQQTRELLTQNPQEAQQTLQAAGYSEQTIQTIQEQMYCEAPESYLIISEDMVGKSGVWSHFGNWDFEKALAYQLSRSHGQQETVQQLTEQTDLDETTARRYYTELSQQPDRRAINQWISPYHSYAGTSSCSENNQTLSCNLGLQVQEGIIADQLTVPLQAPQNSTISLVAQGQRIQETIKPRFVTLNGERYEISGAEIELGARITGDSVVYGQTNVADSVFTQLFYDQEPGPALELISSEQQVTGGQIYVYKIDWDAYNQLI